MYAVALEHARIADGLGFDSLWIAEHHFQRLGTAPNPAVVLGAVAQHTSRIRLGPAVCVLPLRDPIQVAEDYALVDVLSGGRLNLGVGAGSQPMEFEGFGADFDERSRTFEENLEIVERRWHEARAGRRTADGLNVCPVQAPAPPIYVASNRVEAAESIGRKGYSLLTLVSPGLESLDAIGARIAAHRRGLADGGHDGRGAEVVVAVFAHVGESDVAARRVSVPALGCLLDLLAGAAAPDPDQVYDTMRERRTGLFGSASTVENDLERYAQIGVDHVAFLSGFGGMERDAAAHCLRGLASPI